MPAGQQCSPGPRSRSSYRASWAAWAFSKLLLERAQVAVAPGLGFGEHGDGHVRIGLVENTQRLRQAIRNIRGFLQADGVAAPAGAIAAADASLLEATA